MERGADMVEMNSFLCGDCMDYLPQFPDKYFDIAVVDPPYGIGEHGERNGENMFCRKTVQKYLFLMDNMKIVIGITSRQTADILLN